MTASEVCLIIEASAKAEVTVLKFGELQVEFARKLPEPIRIPSPWRPDAIPAAEMVESEKISTEMEELQYREDQIAELLLTDPLAAEEMIRHGELEANESEL